MSCDDTRTLLSVVCIADGFASSCELVQFRIVFAANAPASHMIHTDMGGAKA